MTKTLALLKTKRVAVALVSAGLVLGGAGLVYGKQIVNWANSMIGGSSSDVVREEIEAPATLTPVLSVTPVASSTPTKAPVPTKPAKTDSGLPAGVVYMADMIGCGECYCRADRLQETIAWQEKKQEIMIRTADCRFDVKNAVNPGEKHSVCFTDEEYETVMKANQLVNDYCVNKSGVDVYGWQVSLERLGL